METLQLAKDIVRFIKHVIAEFLASEPMAKLEVILFMIAIGLIATVLWYLFSFIVAIIFIALT